MAMRHLATNAVILRFVAAPLLLALVWAASPAAERMGYPPEEFEARRQRLAEAVGPGTILMFGSTSTTPGVRFRQDNDFFYLTGNESLNAVLVIDAPASASHLFLPKLGADEGLGLTLPYFREEVARLSSGDA